MNYKPYISSKIFAKALFSNFLAFLIAILLSPGIRLCLQNLLVPVILVLLAAAILMALIDPLYLILIRLYAARARARVELRYFLISYVLTLIEAAVFCDPAIVFMLSVLHMLIFLALSYLEKIFEI